MDLPAGAVARLGTTRFNAARPISAVGFAPDGTPLALAAADPPHLLQPFDPTTGEPQPPIPLAERWDRFRYTPDGTLALVGSGTYWILADPLTGVETGRFDQGERLSDVAFSPDGAWAASTGTERNEVWIWDLATRSPIHKLTDHTRSVWCVRFSPDGALLATGSWDGTLRLWEAATGAALVKRKCNNVRALAFSPDGQRIATGSGNGEVRAWSVPQLRSTRGISGRHTFPTAGGNAGVQSVAFSPDGARLYTSGNENLVRAWSAGGPLWTASTQGHDKGPPIAASPDGAWVIVGGHPAGLRRLDAATGALDPQGAPSGTLADLSVAPDGRLAVQRVGQGPVIRTPDGDTSRALAAMRYQRLYWSPDGEHAFLTGVDNRVLDARTFETRWTIQTRSLKGACFTRDGALMALRKGPEVHFWDMAGRAERGRLAHSQDIALLAMAPGGAWVVAVGEDTIGVYTREPAAAVAEAKLQEGTWNRLQRLYDIALSPSGARVAVSRGNLVRVWDVATLAVVCDLEGPHDALQGIGFYGDDRLAAIDECWGVNLADVDAGAWLERRAAHAPLALWRQPWPRPLAVSPDLTRIYAPGMDQNLYAWSVQPGRVGEPVAVRGVASPLDTDGRFGERFAGVSVVFTGSFKDIARAVAERRFKALGGAVVKKPKAGLTALVVGAKTQKPSAVSRAVEAMNAAGEGVQIVSESELIQRLTPMVAESLILLRGGAGGIPEWNGWRSAYGPKRSRLPGAVLDGLDLSGADLRGADLAQISMVGAALKGANLAGVRLSESALARADLREADLSGLDSWRLDLTDADLRGADLTEAKLWHARLDGADLRGADLTELDMRWSQHNESTRWPDGFTPLPSRERSG